MNTLLPLLIVTTIIGLIAAFVIWLVGKLGLGLEVDGFGSAILAAVVIAFLAFMTNVLLAVAGVQDGQGLIGGIVHLIIAVVVLLISGRLLPGLRVKGFVGALVAAAAIGALYWLGGLLLGQLV